MKERKATPPPGYISSEEAARKLGISRDRLYQFVRNGRLPAHLIGTSFLFRVKDIEDFERNPVGRKKVKPTPWRAYKGDTRVLITEIDVQVRANRQEQLVEKLQAIQKGDKHTFPGTIARYVVQGYAQPGSIHISLLWKSTDLPAEALRQTYLTMFQEDLKDVLDWGTAQIQTTEAIIHT